MKRKPVVLIIRDGWGSNPHPEHDPFNAINLARTPCADALGDGWPRTEIITCGPDVGLLEGVMGNSEVGHQNIGAGRVVEQEILRINKSIESGDIKNNAVLRETFEKVKAGGTRLHFMGLASDAGVHSVLPHLYGLLAQAKEAGVPDVCIHAFMDGRDTSPTSGVRFLKQIEEKCRETGLGRIASVCGRFWAMDRDKRWDRVEKAYAMLTGVKAEATAPDAETAARQYYDHPLDSSRKGDEFIVPTWLVDKEGNPRGTVGDGDAVIFFNFRGDRPREITRAFTDEEFPHFGRGKKLDLYYATLTEYEKGLCPHVIFPKPPKMKDILGGYLARRGIPQFRCAETEKYAHVTFFFNDYREEPFDAEERKLVPSPQQVPTYDLVPEMSAYAVKDAAREAVLGGKYGFIVVNFANPDMVGHTGSLEAAIKACETVDECVGDLLDAVDEAGGCAVVTADHGNSEQMWDPETNGPHTSHTHYPVELILYGEKCADLRLRDGGRLADIAPTILELMGLPQPEAMTGRSLLAD